MTDIIHFTTVHSRIDTRIRFKEAETLAMAFPGRVALYVLDGKGDYIDDASSLKIVDAGPRPSSRLKRMIFGSWRMFNAVRRARPKVAHFHDPELIAVGLGLKLFGIKVIYDIHEDLPKQVLSKNYIRPVAMRHILALFIRFVEGLAVRIFDLSVTAVDSIAERFPVNKTMTVRNYPRVELMLHSTNEAGVQNPFIVNYAGSLTRLRGIHDLVVAMSHLPEHFELHLLGNFNPPSLLEECKAHPGWSHCHYHGRVPHDEVAKYLSQAHLGVQLTHDIPNHRTGLATKVFEYLFLSIPVLVSDNADKRGIYGSFVDYAEPQNPKAIAAKIREVADNYDTFKADAISNGVKAREQFSWESEAAPLIARYEEMLG